MSAKTFRVTWNEVYLCAREVEAESEAEALRIVQDDEHSGTADPDQKEFADYESWECEEVGHED